MRRVCMVVVAAVCAIGAGCAYNANLTLTGSFAGTASDSTTVGAPQPNNWTWTISQTGSAFTGTFSSLNATNPTVLKGYTGTMTGSTNGNSMSFTVTVPAGGVTGQPLCTVNLSGSGTVVASAAPLNTTTVSGTFSGSSSCGGTISDGSFNVTRSY